MRKYLGWPDIKIVLFNQILVGHKVCHINVAFSFVRSVGAIDYVVAFPAELYALSGIASEFIISTGGKCHLMFLSIDQVANAI